MSVRIFFACCIMLILLAGCDRVKDSYEESFKETYQKNFVLSCTESAVKNGAPEEEAKEKCECIAVYLVNSYSSAELTKLKDTESPESRKILENAMDYCRLYQK